MRTIGKEYILYSKKELADKLNFIVNNKVNELGKKMEIPLEVEFFPRHQIPKRTISLYKQILEKKNIQQVLPPKATLVHNITSLVNNVDPELLKEIHSRNIDVLNAIIYDENP